MGRRRGRLITAAIASGLFHLGLATALIWASHARRHLPEPRNAGVIEMVMVQQKGSATARPQASAQATPAATPPKPASPPPKTAEAKPKEDKPARPQAPPVPDKADQPPAQGVPAAAAAKAALPQSAASETTKPAAPAPAAAAPAPPAAAAAPEKVAKASSTPVSKAPVFDLSGTDDEFTAEAYGGKIIPASPDSRFHNNPPRYPREAALRGEQGAVVLLIHVSDTGMATGADIVETSGVPSLDEAAVAAVRNWHFHPALRDGKAVPFDVPFRFVFEGE